LTDATPTRSLPPVLVMGGTFDPPHRVHADMLRRAAAQLGAAHALVVPAWRNPQRDRPGASPEHRLAMARIAFAAVPSCTVLDLEVAGGAPAFTIDTIRTISGLQRTGTLPRGALRLVIGSDQAMNFDTWRDWRSLADAAPPAVVLRPPHRHDTWPSVLHDRFGADMARRWSAWTLPIEPIEASGTAARERLAQGQDAGNLLDPAVLAYLRRHGLYGAAGERE